MGGMPVKADHFKIKAAWGGKIEEFCKRHKCKPVAPKRRAEGWRLKPIPEKERSSAPTWWVCGRYD